MGNLFWEKLKFKLDIFTVGKILIKLILFKKLVSFIGLICLFLFLPWIKNKTEHAVGDGDKRDLKKILSPGKYIHNKYMIVSFDSRFRFLSNNFMQ